MAIKAALLGAKGFSALVKAAGGRYIGHPAGGRVFVGRDAAAAVRAEGFKVEAHVGPRDPGVSDAAWAWHVARAGERANVFFAHTPVGELAI